MKGEPTTVEALFRSDGDITPQRFEWHGRMIRVQGVGRRWREENERCFNVMALGERVFQLRLNVETLRWSVSRGSGPPLVV